MPHTMGGLTARADEGDDGLGSIRAHRVPELVAQQIREAILAGKLAPGERLVELKLGARFGIGQPTVREALRELEYQGFVRKQGNRGTYVTKYSTEDIRKILEVRMVLEAFAIESAAPRVSDEDAADLNGFLDDMAECARRFDRAGFHKSDLAFHRKIWTCAQNEYLETALERIALSLFAFMLVGRTPEDEVMSNVVQQHRDILESLLTRDPATARERFVKSTVRFWEEHHGIVLGLCPK